MGKVLIIGAGGVATVAAHKVAQKPQVFNEVMIASRTKSKCDHLAEVLNKKYGTNVQTAQVDADSVEQLVELLSSYKPDIVMNLALPYQDLTIMEACLQTGCNYLDTANYEPKDEAHFEYSWQWAYRERFEKAGLTAILGCGFDPGVTSISSRWRYIRLCTIPTSVPRRAICFITKNWNRLCWTIPPSVAHASGWLSVSSTWTISMSFRT